MTVALYMDVHVPKAISLGLKLRGVDVRTAQEDGAGRKSDEWLIDRATELRRVLFTQDMDALRIAAALQRTGKPFGGVIYSHQRKATAGVLIEDLEMIAKIGQPEDFRNRVEYIPIN